MRKALKIIEEMGGKFVSSPLLIRSRLQNTNVLLFDWDGVFHSGYKNENESSRFSEADSMGVNMLRYACWLQNGSIPYTAIISGENNKTARFFAEREHFDALFSGVKNKREVLDFLKTEKRINPAEALFVFDDILDLSLVKEVGLKFMVNRNASAIFTDICQNRGWCDYVTAYNGENHAVREVCEVCLSLMNRMEEVIEKRVKYGEDYQPYIKERNTIVTQFFDAGKGGFSIR